MPVGVTQETDQIVHCLGLDGFVTFLVVNGNRAAQHKLRLGQPVSGSQYLAQHIEAWRNLGMVRAKVFLLKSERASDQGFGISESVLLLQQPNKIGERDGDIDLA